MSRSPLALYSDWRDYCGMWNPLIEPILAPLDKSECHATRLVLVPDITNILIPASGKIEFNFHLVPGSLIWGFVFDVNTGNPAVQLTDVNMGHQFFQDPVNAQFLKTQGANFGRFPSFTLLPTPHPVVGDGLFTFEAWGTPADSVILILGVAEVTTCKTH
jgi:hypothetical protein